MTQISLFGSSGFLGTFGGSFSGISHFSIPQVSTIWAGVRLDVQYLPIDGGLVIKRLVGHGLLCTRDVHCINKSPMSLSALRQGPPPPRSSLCRSGIRTSCILI